MADALNYKSSETFFDLVSEARFGFLILIKIAAPDNPIALFLKPRAKC